MIPGQCPFFGATVEQNVIECDCGYNLLTGVRRRKAKRKDFHKPSKPFEATPRQILLFGIPAAFAGSLLIACTALANGSSIGEAAGATFLLFAFLSCLVGLGAGGRFLYEKLTPRNEDGEIDETIHQQHMKFLGYASVTVLLPLFIGAPVVIAFWKQTKGEVSAIAQTVIWAVFGIGAASQLIRSWRHAYRDDDEPLIS